MKRLLSLMLLFSLLLGLSLPARGDKADIYDVVREVMKELNEYPGAYDRGYEPYVDGHAIIAVCDSLTVKNPRLSLDLTDGAFYCFPEKAPLYYLAGDLDEAQWLFLIYPFYPDSEDNTPQDGHRVETRISPVALSDRAVYEPIIVTEEFSSLTKTRFRTVDEGFRPDEAVERVAELLGQGENNRAEVDYQEALILYEQKDYYGAYRAFRAIDYADSRERAQACIQKWPRNGEIWHNRDYSGTGMELTVKVNQADDVALYVRIYKGDTLMSCLFIGGTGQATAKLPGGTYTIYDGSGRNWFGKDQAFGKEGHYEIMTFDDGKETVSLKNNYAYTITINVKESNPDTDPIESEYTDYETFMK